MNLNDYCLGRPLHVGTDPVLLVDDVTVEDRWGVYRHLEAPFKDPRNPLLMADMPWEDGIGAPNVLFDPEAKRYRMWYTASDWNAWIHQFKTKDWRAARDGYPYFICYAESADGVAWERPLLENRPYKDHERTNVLVTGAQKAQAGRVTWNHPSTGQPGRFLMTYKDNLPQGHGAFCLAFSDNGVDWREHPDNPACVGLQDTWQNMLFDAENERWLLFTRPLPVAGVADVPGGPTEHNYKRRVAVMIGDTPFSFGAPRSIMWPDERDAPDFDHMIVSRAGSHFVGFLGQMGPRPEMRFDIHLAFSGDGLHWKQLPERIPFIAPGGPEAFDSGSASSAGGLVHAGRRTHIYYRGGRRGQAQNQRNTTNGIGRVSFLADRFAAQMGPHTGGFFLTREMRVDAPELVINTTVATGWNADAAHATEPPELGVEILSRDAAGSSPSPVPGYTLADCTTPAVDLDKLVVTWRERKDLAELVGRPVFIRFYLKNTGIYSLQFRSPVS